MRKHVFGHDTDSEGPDQGLHCPPTESLDTIECINGKQMPGWDIAHAQGDPALRILRMFDDTFFRSARPSYEVKGLKIQDVNR